MYVPIYHVTKNALKWLWYSKATYFEGSLLDSALHSLQIQQMCLLIFLKTKAYRYII